MTTQSLLPSSTSTESNRDPDHLQAVDFSILAITLITLLTIQLRSFIIYASATTKALICLSIWIVPLCTSTCSSDSYRGTLIYGCRHLRMDEELLRSSLRQLVLDRKAILTTALHPQSWLALRYLCHLALHLHLCLCVHEPPPPPARSFQPQLQHSR